MRQALLIGSGNVPRDRTPRGMFAKADQTVPVQGRFSGRGLAISTASTAIEYAVAGTERRDINHTAPGC